MKAFALRHNQSKMPVSSSASPRDQRLEAHGTALDAAICKVPPGNGKDVAETRTQKRCKHKAVGAAVNVRSNTKIIMVR